MATNRKARPIVFHLQRTMKNTRIDASQLLGAEVNGDTYSCIIDDKRDIQETYTFLHPIAEYRSVDGEDENILSWRPKTDTYERHREWRENGFRVPEDLHLSDKALGVLTDVRGVSRESDDSTSIELYTPVLDEDDARRLKQSLLIDHDVIATHGIGRDPLLVKDEESVETLKSFQREW